MFSKTCKYAIRAILFLAVNTNDNKKIGVDELAKELAVPKHFLAKILQKLSRNRMISSTRGRNGGFYLSKQNKTANLLTVIETFDGIGVFTDCILGLDYCSNDNPCPYHYSVQDYRSMFFMSLQDETIDASAKRIREQGLKLRNRV